MKISDFVTSMSMTGGLARTNRFSIIMDLPWAALPTKDLIPFNELQLMCDQVQLPGLSVNTAPIRTFGEIRETPYEMTYEPIQFTFYSDAGMNINAYFSEWIKNIVNPTRRSFRYYDDYICKQMQILVQDTEDYSRYQVNLYEVYPKSIGAVQLDYASKDVMKFTVTMIFKHWEYAVLDKPKTEVGNNIYTRGLTPGLDFFDPDYEQDINETYPIDGETDVWGNSDSNPYDSSIPASGNNSRGIGAGGGGGGGVGNNGASGGGGGPSDSFPPDSLPSQGDDSDPYAGDSYQNDELSQDETTSDDYTDTNPTEEEYSGYEGDDELDF